MAGKEFNLGDFSARSTDYGNAFVVEGLTELAKKLDQLQVNNPEMEKKIQKIIAKGLQMVRKNVSDAMRAKMDSDPREAYKAVRRTVYRRILGGNVNILQNKRAGDRSTYQPTRTMKSGQRGGNRRLRSERTLALESYSGRDRGFILRFLEGGARKGGGRRQERGFRNDPHRDQVKRGSQGGDISKYGKTTNTGSRGSISARHVFSGVAEHGMSNAIAFIEREIDKLIQQEFGNG
jgi:hypothetical protein